MAELLRIVTKGALKKSDGSRTGVPCESALATIAASDSARVLGAQMKSDLTMSKHAIAVNALSFINSGRCVQIYRSLNNEATAALEHAFVVSRLTLSAGRFHDVINRPSENRSLRH